MYLDEAPPTFLTTKNIKTQQRTNTADIMTEYHSMSATATSSVSELDKSVGILCPTS